MPEATPLEARYQECRRRFREVGQEHVLHFWKELDAARRAELLEDLARIDLAQLPAQARLAVTDRPPNLDLSRLSPVKVIRREQAGPEALARGRLLLAAGKVAAFTVAGGQGTRLGFDGPKGAFCISPVRNKPLFQLFAESVLATSRRYGREIPWYIMTSPANDAATREFFDRHRHFGLDPRSVTFFQQGVMPAFDRQGKILLDQKHRVALSPNGHGGSLLALAQTGMLADLRQRGIDYISYFQVDNPLVYALDPVFIGLHDLRRSEMSSKSLPKADDLERVGNFVMLDGRLMVIEYSDMPETLARAHNPDGSRKYDAGSIAIHILSRDFVERLTADPAAFALPWHRAVKKVPYVDLATGQRIEPAEPNAVKLESFVFDALPLAENPIVVETSRAEEFSPVKNATGVDSVETTRRDLVRRAARWLESVGFRVPRRDDGEPDALLEISPLLALDAHQLAERRLKPDTIARGEKRYFE